jgi:mannan endo-1,4-beta-mannosidase
MFTVYPETSNPKPFAGSFLHYNPGAGAQCEGEDWLLDNAIPGYEVASAHIYYRQMEYMRAGPRDWYNWIKPNLTVYTNFLAAKVELLTQLAGAIDRYVVIKSS